MAFLIGDRFKVKDGPWSVNGLFGTVKGIDNAWHRTYYDVELDDGHKMSLTEDQMEFVPTYNMPKFGIGQDENKNSNLPNEITTLEAAIRFENESKKKKWGTVAQEWIKEGRCPTCGEKCFYHLSTPVCPKHGTYE